jgi:beta-glucosidase
LEKPAKELKGYAKTDELNPGQSQTITIQTPIYWLTSYSEDLGAWILDAGDYDCAW